MQLSEGYKITPWVGLVHKQSFHQYASDHLLDQGAALFENVKYNLREELRVDAWVS